MIRNKRLEQTPPLIDVETVRETVAMIEQDLAASSRHAGVAQALRQVLAEIDKLPTEKNSERTPKWAAPTMQPLRFFARKRKSPREKRDAFRIV